MPRQRIKYGTRQPYARELPTIALEAKTDASSVLTASELRRKLNGVHQRRGGAISGNETKSDLGRDPSSHYPKSHFDQSSWFSSTKEAGWIKDCQANVAPRDKRVRSGLSFAEGDRGRCRVTWE